MSEAGNRWSVTVTDVSREYLGVPNDKGFWVSYILLDGKFPDYHGHRLVVAQDELEVYTRFPLMMLKRHGTNNVSWLLKEAV